MELSPVQQATLVDLLIYGDDKAGNIGQRTGFHANSVSRSIPGLVDENRLKEKGDGVYRLTDSGREAAIGLLRGGYNPYVDDE